MPIELSNAWRTGAKIINSSISLLPNIVLAVVQTKEGRKVVIPNALLFTNPVAVGHSGPKN